MHSVVYVSVCPSVRRCCCTKMAEWIQLIFGTEDILGLSYTTSQGNLTTFKIRVLPSRILSQTLNIAEFLCFFHHSMSIITNVVHVVRPLQVYYIKHQPFLQHISRDAEHHMVCLQHRRFLYLKFFTGNFTMPQIFFNEFVQQ